MGCTARKLCFYESLILQPSKLTWDSLDIAKYVLLATANVTWDEFLLLFLKARYSPTFNPTYCT